MERSKLIPKLAENIVFHDFSQNHFFIHQKDYDHRIKISIDTYNLIRKIDGKKTLEQIKEEINENISIDLLYKILYENLGKYGIIKNNLIEVKAKDKPSYLKLSFIVIPSKFISRITPFLKFLFHTNVIKVLIPLCLLLIASTLITSYNEILNQSFEKSNWITFFSLGFLSVTFHEFGHVTATEFFGAKQDGIGGGFYLFSPVYFADVTDIWKLKPKQRIIVNLAGIYFELIICSIYIIIGLLFQTKLIIILAIVIFLRTLFNLNPFLRSDGYWILTDTIGIANLYKVSNNALLTFLKSLFKKNVAFRYNLRNILLSCYASVNYLLLIIFIGYVIIFNSNSVIYFPVNFFNFIKNTINGNGFSLINLAEFIIPLLFYYLLFSLIKNLIIRKRKRITVPNTV
jgi:putative peptide zinc metalloprotease protein